MARAILIMQALNNENRRAERRRIAVLRRTLREHNSMLDLSENEFRGHYRLTKALFLQLCDELSPYLPRANRRTAISVECKVAATLSLYATGSCQKPVGMNYIHGLSQAGVSKSVREVTNALNHPDIVSRYIHFPKTVQERQAVINGFSNKFGFPGCLGCIDCTHVALVRPSEDEDRFFNEKQYFSRNVQIICDSDLNILNVNAAFGGDAHDELIWLNSKANWYLQDLHQQGENGWLLGDSAYPLRPWLLTPIINAEPNSPEENYTTAHTTVRNTVERCIGAMKARWRCLLAHHVLHYDPHMVAKIINACSVLHNICNMHHLPVPKLPNAEVQKDINRQIPVQGVLDDDEFDDVSGVDVYERRQLERGRLQRERVIRELWDRRGI